MALLNTNQTDFEQKRIKAGIKSGFFSYNTSKRKESMNFCHISPTPHLADFVEGRPFHLTLAHLVEVDDNYTKFYVDQKQKHNCVNILDNSAFEMYKQGRPMYQSSKLIEMGKKINADYIVMSDYPGEESTKTIEAAKVLAPQFKSHGFGTFFVPQSQVGDWRDLIYAFAWAAESPELVDYIGVSILGVPNAFGVEKGNKLQRFLARWKFMDILKKNGVLDKIKQNGQKIHFLGMVDGPNEIELMSDFGQYIDTWDSSAAVWLGLSGGRLFDNSPTGLINGKYEVEVDFDFQTQDQDKIEKAKQNIQYIDKLVKGL